MVGEVVHVQAEGTIRTQVDELVEDLVDESGLAIGRHTHHLVLALVDLEAQERSECGV